MFLLALNNANFQFDTKKLTWRFYSIAKALRTTSQVKLINKSEFAKVALNKNFKTFVIYMTVLETEVLIHSL